LLIFFLWSRACSIVTFGGRGLAHPRAKLGCLTSLVLLAGGETAAIVLATGWHRLLCPAAAFIALYLGAWRSNRRATVALTAELESDGFDQSTTSQTASKMVRQVASGKATLSYKPTGGTKTGRG
jgi:hypothetical protein